MNKLTNRRVFQFRQRIDATSYVGFNQIRNIKDYASKDTDRVNIDCGTTPWNICYTLSDVECLYRGPHYMHRPHTIRHSNSASIYNSPDAQPHHTQHNTNTGFVAFIHSFIIQRVLHCRLLSIQNTN